MDSDKHKITDPNLNDDYSSTAFIFEKIFKNYFIKLCHFSFQIVGDKETAEDIVQEAFVKYWSQREGVAREDVVIKSFLYNTVRNASLNTIRHEKVMRKYANEHIPAVEEKSTIHNMIRSEVFAEIYMAIKSLPPSCQRISRMAYLESMKNAEIAQKLKLSINTVKTQKKRALQHLRLKLNGINE